jgi:magnesium transporter
MPEKEKPILTDESKEGVGHLLSLRLPWLIVGLLGGLVATMIVSHFEAVLKDNLALAFFLPVIVYMSDAVGTQTETIYVRNLATGRVSLAKYFVKELVLGLVLGTFFGVLVALFATLMLGSTATGFTIGLAMAATVATAPVVALVVPALLQKERIDPALGAGPFSTILQDLLSVLIYFLIASILLFRP